jgi:hypothetical protein
VNGKDKPSFLELKTTDGFQLKLGPSFGRMLLGIITLLFVALKGPEVGKLLDALGPLLRVGKHFVP